MLQYWETKIFHRSNIIKELIKLMYAFKSINMQVKESTLGNLIYISWYTGVNKVNGIF